MAKRGLSLQERMMSRVAPPHPKTGCWEWTGARHYFGYGRMGIARPDGTQTTEVTHRVAWTVFRGPIPDGVCVCHKCDNPPCVNPDHLFLGSHIDNMRDCQSKGRGRHYLGSINAGSSHGMSKLTEPDVAAIKTMLAGGTKQSVIAHKFGVTQTAISRINTGKRWRHV